MPRLRALFALASAVGLTFFLACSSFEDAPPDDAADGGSDSSSASDSNVGPAVDASIDASDAGGTRSDQYRALVLSDNPLVYWRMNRVASAGIVVPDETANKNDLLLINTTDILTDVSGVFPGDRAVRFGGDTAHALATSSAPLAFDGVAPFTFELWARRELSDAGDAGSFLQHLVSSVDGNSNNGTLSGFLLYLRFGENTFLEHGSLDAGNIQIGTSLVTFGEWAHYAVVFDGSDLALFVDGQQKGKQTVKGPLLPRVAPFTIAKASNESVRNFQGSMAEIAVYGKQLPAKTIIDHYALVVGQ